MLAGIAFTLIAGLLWAAIGVAYSVMAQRRLGFFAVMGPAFAVTAALSWMVLPDHRLLGSGTLERLGWLVAVMAGAGSVTVIGMTCMQSGMRRGHHGACWAVGQSALIAPYLCGVLLFGEPLVWQRTLGVALVVGSLVAFGWARDVSQADDVPGDRKWFGLATCSLILLSLAQSLTTLPSHWKEWTDTAHLRVPLFFTGLAAAYAVGAFVEGKRPGKAELCIAASLVALSLPSHFCLYRAMDHLKPLQLVGIVYPLAVGTCILGFALYSLLVLRERTTTLHVVGLVVGLAGIVCMSLG